jgi:hypothetical protein
MVHAALHIIVFASSFRRGNIADGMEECSVVRSTNTTDLWETGGDTITSYTVQGFRPPIVSWPVHSRDCSSTVYHDARLFIVGQTFDDKLGARGQRPSSRDDCKVRINARTVSRWPSIPMAGSNHFESKTQLSIYL